MINSMTGYGRAGQVLGGRDISVEVRSVNHRYFEFAVRSPRTFSYLEEKIKQTVQARVSRGKIEVLLTVINVDVADADIELNMPLAKSYAEALARISLELGVPNEAGAGAIARFPDVFTMKRAVPDEEQVWVDVKQVLDEALDKYCEMRSTEGKKLREDILERLNVIGGKVGQVETQASSRLDSYREKLGERMKAVLENVEIDESRILLEAALYADKSAIDEETVRLRSHLSQFDAIFASDVPVGRKLDFLVQEMNREVNTIGSKANDIDITAAVVDMKAEIEKIREQIQNIE
jgi:TIGR00255 family protein